MKYAKGSYSAGECRSTINERCVRLWLDNALKRGLCFRLKDIRYLHLWLNMQVIKPRSGGEKSQEEKEKKNKYTIEN